jgi:hypothetical protein
MIARLIVEVLQNSIRCYRIIMQKRYDQVYGATSIITNFSPDVLLMKHKLFDQNAGSMDCISPII